MTQRRKWNKSLVIQEIKSLESKLERRPTKRDSSNLYSLTIRFFGGWNAAMKIAGFNVRDNQEPNLPSKLDENLAYFLGLLITDGHIVFDEVHKKYKVMIFSSYDKERKILIQLIKELFNYNPKIRAKKYGFNKLTNYEIYMTSKKLAEFLTKKLKIPSGSKSRIARVPRYFFKEDNKIVAGFLRGVIDGDGSVGKTHISVSSGSPSFLGDIKKLLIKQDIIFGNIHTNLAGSNTSEMRMYRKEDLRRFHNFLYSHASFFYPRKKQSWEDLKNRIN